MKTIVLGSGSKGNSTLVITKNIKVLIDVGFSYPKMKMLLNEYNVEPGDIDAILITHTHKDHVLGLASFVKRNNTKVYTNSKMYNELSKMVCSYDILTEEHNFQINDLDIEVIPTSHDAIGSVGFIVHDDYNSLVYITDTGYINKKYINKLVDKNLYIFESNHDIEMLMNGPYPYILKQRVLSDKGHLSNEMAGNYLHDIVGNHTKKIVLAHLSETNNKPDIAYNTVLNILDDKKNSIILMIAKQNETIDVGEF